MEDEKIENFVTSYEINRSHTYYEQSDFVIYENNDSFGIDVKFEISNDRGDFVSKISFFITLPLDVDFVEDIEYALIKKINFIIGGQIIHTLTNDQIYMYSKKQKIASKNENKFFLTIPFFTNNCLNSDIGSSLPLCSMYYHTVCMNVEYENINKLVKYEKFVNNTDMTFKCKAIGEFYFVTDCEKNRFQNCCHEYLVKLNQCFYDDVTNENFMFDKNIGFAVRNLKFAFRDKTSNIYFNYLPICEHIKLNITANTKYKKSGNELLNYDNNIYEWSFELEQNKFEPSGSVNFEKIESLFEFKLLKKDVIFVFSTEYSNVLNISSGMCSLRFVFDFIN